METSLCFKSLKKLAFLRQFISSTILVCFISSLIVPPASAQVLPVPGTAVGLTPGYQPPVLLGLKIHPENPLLFDFIVDQGQSKLSQDELKLETEKLVKYFLAALTIPDKEVWVNLSPSEKDRIIPDVLGQTMMGKTMLEQDYILKQLASSLTNPNTELGKKYWSSVGSDSQDLSKVWIVPSQAEVLESNGIVLVGEKRLKVMMQEEHENKLTSSQVFRTTILPNIEKEVNEGKTFANVRQVYNSVILAAWYKQALKESLLGKVYADQGKVAGVESGDKEMKQRIYEQYLAAFKKGVYNLIKEEIDTTTGETIPRKYFSGGENFIEMSRIVSSSAISAAQAGQMIEKASASIVTIQLADGNAELNFLRNAVGSSSILNVPVNNRPLDLTGFQTVRPLSLATTTEIPNERTIYFEPPQQGMQIEYIAGYSPVAFAKELEAYRRFISNSQLIETGNIPRPLEMGNIQPPGNKVAALMRTKTPYLKVQALPRARTFENTKTDELNGNQFNVTYWLDKYILLAQTYAKIHAAGVLPLDIYKKNIRVHRDTQNNIDGFMIMNFHHTKILPEGTQRSIASAYPTEFRYTLTQLKEMIVGDLHDSFLHHFIAPEKISSVYDLADSLGLYQLIEKGTRYFQTAEVREMADMIQRLQEMKAKYQQLVEEGSILSYGARDHVPDGKLPVFYTSLTSGPVKASNNFNQASDEFKEARIENVANALRNYHYKIKREFVDQFPEDVLRTDGAFINEFVRVLDAAYAAGETEAMKPILRAAYDKYDVLFDNVAKFDDQRNPKRYHRALAMLVRTAFAVLTPAERAQFFVSEVTNESEFVQRLNRGDLSVFGMWDNLIKFTQERAARRTGEPVKVAATGTGITDRLLLQRRKQAQREREQVNAEADRLLVSLEEKLPALRIENPTENAILNVILREVLYEGYYIFLEDNSVDAVISDQLDSALIQRLAQLAVPGLDRALTVEEVDDALAKLGFENRIAGADMREDLNMTLSRLAAYIAVGKIGDLRNVDQVLDAIKYLETLPYGAQINMSQFAASYKLSQIRASNLLTSKSYEQVGDSAEWMNLKSASSAVENDVQMALADAASEVFVQLGVETQSSSEIFDIVAQLIRKDYASEGPPWYIPVTFKGGTRGYKLNVAPEAFPKFRRHLETLKQMGIREAKGTSGPIFIVTQDFKFIRVIEAAVDHFAQAMVKIAKRERLRTAVFNLETQRLALTILNSRNPQQAAADYRSFAGDLAERFTIMGLRQVNGRFIAEEIIKFKTNNPDLGAVLLSTFERMEQAYGSQLETLGMPYMHFQMVVLPMLDSAEYARPGAQDLELNAAELASAILASDDLPQADKELYEFANQYLEGEFTQTPVPQLLERMSALSEIGPALQVSYGKLLVQPDVSPGEIVPQFASLLVKTATYVKAASSGVDEPSKNSFNSEGDQQLQIAFQALNYANGQFGYTKEDILRALQAAAESEKIADTSRLVTDFGAQDLNSIRFTQAYTLIRSNVRFRDSFMFFLLNSSDKKSSYFKGENDYFAHLSAQFYSARTLLALSVPGGFADAENKVAEYQTSYRGDDKLKLIRVQRYWTELAQQVLRIENFRTAKQRLKETRIARAGHRLSDWGRNPEKFSQRNPLARITQEVYELVASQRSGSKFGNDNSTGADFIDFLKAVRVIQTKLPYPASQPEVEKLLADNYRRFAGYYDLLSIGVSYIDGNTPFQWDDKDHLGLILTVDQVLTDEQKDEFFERYRTFFQSLRPRIIVNNFGDLKFSAYHLYNAGRGQVWDALMKFIEEKIAEPEKNKKTAAEETSALMARLTGSDQVKPQISAEDLNDLIEMQADQLFDRLEQVKDEKNANVLRLILREIVHDMYLRVDGRQSVETAMTTTLDQSTIAALSALSYGGVRLSVTEMIAALGQLGFNAKGLPEESFAPLLRKTLEILSASSGVEEGSNLVNRRDFFKLAAGLGSALVITNNTQAQTENIEANDSVKVIAEDFESREQDDGAFAAWKDGDYNLKEAASLRITFPKEQAGVKFYVRLLRRKNDAQRERGLSFKSYVVPQDGVILISIDDFIKNFLEKFEQISIHSGSKAWNKQLGQDGNSRAIPLTIEAISKVSSSAVGGINFDPTNMNLQIKRDGRGVPLPLPQQNLEQINIEGLFPVIINIVPINVQNLSVFLGSVPVGEQAPKEAGKEPSELETQALLSSTS
jgi:hypothetical protein